jgi:hypothetical protein
MFGNLGLYEEDAPKKMRWKEAIQYAEELGDGWRLPTYDEFKAIRAANKDLKATVFQKDYYWCSEEVYPGSRDAITIHMSKGAKYEDTKTCLSYVRIVKDMVENVSDPVSTIVSKVKQVLSEIISQNEKELSEEMDFKIVTNYGYGKFYLGKLDGSYDMSLYALVHYILFEEKLYPLFLTKQQLKDVGRLIKDFPESIYRPDETAENYDYVQYEVLDEVTSRAFEYVRLELQKRGFATSEFDTQLGLD